MVDTKVTLSGIKLDNPIIPASGTFGFGYEFAELYDINLLGTFSFKGTTKDARFGNPTPRIAECESGLINSVGLQNPGVEKVKTEELPKLKKCFSKPVMATVALWLSVGSWNGWMDTLLYITDRSLYPLTYIMMQLIKESSLAQQMATESGAEDQASKPTPDTVKAATLVVTTIPIIMVYPFLQKYFMKGVTLGAVKG